MSPFHIKYEINNGSAVNIRKENSEIHYLFFHFESSEIHMILSVSSMSIKSFSTLFLNYILMRKPKKIKKCNFEKKSFFCLSFFPLT
jgi:hypothetical protein